MKLYIMEEVDNINNKDYSGNVWVSDGVKQTNKFIELPIEEIFNEVRKLYNKNVLYQEDIELPRTKRFLDWD